MIGSPLPRDLAVELIRDHAAHPHGRLPHRGSVEVLPGWEPSASDSSPTCGDEVTVRVRLEGDRIAELAWTGQGCTVSQASASMLADVLVGRSAADARATVDAVRGMLRGGELPDERVAGDALALATVVGTPLRASCALLAWLTLGRALPASV
jgi:nitrogen fixation protein NifU and related proteins